MKGMLARTIEIGIQKARESPYCPTCDENDSHHVVTKRGDQMRHLKSAKTFGPLHLESQTFNVRTIWALLNTFLCIRTM